MTSTIKYIIIQAGGRGSRLEYLTDNKPKTLVSVNGEPMIINQMRMYPKAHYYVIADYKQDVLEKYLKKYAPASYEIIYATGKQTCSGISECLTRIPENTPFLLVWCDLFFTKYVFPKRLQIKDKNYVGLSNTFSCRWMFEKGNLREEKSTDHGVAGVFLFKNKKEIEDVPDNGEFCEYLAKKNEKLSSFFLKGVHEVGTIEAYASVTQHFPHTRPFNTLSFKDTVVIKKPKDAIGKKLAKLEINWYKHHKDHLHDFLPEIYKYYPLTLQMIAGKPLHQAKLSTSIKKKVLKQIVTSLQTIHTEAPPKKSSLENDHFAILGKTKDRLDSIAPLIPLIESDTLVINGKTCINFYKQWDIVENLLSSLFSTEYVHIHGDSTFSNTLYDPEKQKTYFIDPRGYYGDSKLYGDEDYDWAKLYYSIVGNYDQFNEKRFRLSIEANCISLTTDSNGWEPMEDYFLDLIKRDSTKIKAYHAIIWLSLTSYAWDNYDSICAAFYKGIYLMQEVYENSLSKSN